MTPFNRDRILPYLCFLTVFALLLSACKKDEPTVDDEPIETDDDLPVGELLEIEWIRTYGGSGEDDAVSVTHTNDGGYLVLGFTQSTDGDIVDKTTTDHDLWLLKLNAEGDIMWSKTYGGSLDDRGSKVIQTMDGGYAMAGFTRSNDGDVSENAGFIDYWLVKLDNQGNLQWEQTHGYAGNDQATSLLQTPDGGYLINGYLDVTASEGQGNDDAKSGLRHGVGEYWPVKTDANGQYEWRRYFGGTDNDRPYDLLQADNGDFIMVGNSESDDYDITDPRGSYDYWVVRITDAGDWVWGKNFGGSDIEIAYALTKTADGNYLIIGDTRSNDQDVSQNYGNADAWLIKIDNSGNLLWETNHGGSQFDTGRAVLERHDGTIFVAGTSRSSDFDVADNNGQSDFWLYITDPNGQILWQKNVGGNQLEFANDALQNADGSIVVVGSSTSDDQDIPVNRGSKDVLVVKFR